MRFFRKNNTCLIKKGFFFFNFLFTFFFLLFFSVYMFPLLLQFYDLLFFMCILFIILLGYGIAVHVILYPQVTEPEAVVEYILYRPYFQIYGELFLDDIRGKKTSQFQFFKIVKKKKLHFILCMKMNTKT